MRKGRGKLTKSEKRKAAAKKQLDDDRILAGAIARVDEERRIGELQHAAVLRKLGDSEVRSASGFCAKVNECKPVGGTVKDSEEIAKQKEEKKLCVEQRNARRCSQF